MDWNFAAKTVMNTTHRIVRFQRLKHFDQLKLDRLAVAARSAAIRLRKLQSLRDATHAELEEGLNAGVLLESLGQVQTAVWARSVQQRLTKLDELLKRAQEEHVVAQSLVHQQQNKVKVWENLLDQLAARERLRQERLDGNEADESFNRKRVRLSTRSESKSIIGDPPQ